MQSHKDDVNINENKESDYSDSDNSSDFPSPEVLRNSLTSGMSIFDVTTTTLLKPTQSRSSSSKQNDIAVNPIGLVNITIGESLWRLYYFLKIICSVLTKLSVLSVNSITNLINWKTEDLISLIFP